MDVGAALRIQCLARGRLARKVTAARSILRIKRDDAVVLLAPLYEELYELPTAKDVQQHVKLLHRLIIKNICGHFGDSLTEAPSL